MDADTNGDQEPNPTDVADPALTGPVGASLFGAGPDTALLAQLQAAVPTQPGPDVSGYHYLGHSQSALYAMVRDRADPSAVAQQGASYTKLGEALVTIADELDQANRASAGGWTGSAADAARAFTDALISWHRSAGEGGQLAGIRTHEQAQALQQARAAMPPPVPQPSLADLARAMSGANALNLTAAVSQWMADHQRAVDNHQRMAQVAAQYDRALGASAVLPVFEPPQATLPPTGGTSVEPVGAPAGAGAGRPAAAPAPRPGATRPAGAPAAGAAESPTQPSAPVPALDLEWATPGEPARGTVAATAGAGPDIDRPTGGGAAPADGQPAVEAEPGRPTAGAGTGTNRPPGVGEPADGQIGRSSGSAAERAAARSSPAVEGTAAEGRPVGAPPPAGRRPADEDHEHRRPGYLSADPATLFSDPQSVVPPVIGEQ